MNIKHGAFRIKEEDSFGEIIVAIYGKYVPLKIKVK